MQRLGGAFRKRGLYRKLPNWLCVLEARPKCFGHPARRPPAPGAYFVLPLRSLCVGEGLEIGANGRPLRLSVYNRVLAAQYANAAFRFWPGADGLLMGVGAEERTPGRFATCNCGSLRTFR